MNVPSSLSFEKWLEDRDKNRKRESSETRVENEKTKRDYKVETLGRRFAVTEDSKGVQGLYRETIRRAKDEGRRVRYVHVVTRLLVRWRFDVFFRSPETMSDAEFRKILGRVLFSMRASSIPSLRKFISCSSDSSELFFKTREEAESRLKTLKSNRRKEMRKNLKMASIERRKLKLRAQKKKQNKKKEV